MQKSGLKVKIPRTRLRTLPAKERAGTNPWWYKEAGAPREEPEIPCAWQRTPQGEEWHGRRGCKCTWRPLLFSRVVCWAQHSAASYGSNGDGVRAVFHQRAIFSRQEDSTKHFNFSSFDGERRKEARHQYRVRSQKLCMSGSAQGRGWEGGGRGSGAGEL